MKYLLGKLGFWKRSTLVTLYSDNQSSIEFSKYFVFHNLTKHIDIRFFRICKAVSIKQFNIVYITIADVAANGLSKGLPTHSLLELQLMIDKKVKLKMLE